MVIGHWHHQLEDFVCAALAADLRKRVPPKFQVLYWAEIEPPPGIKPRPLTKQDTKGRLTSCRPSPLTSRRGAAWAPRQGAPRYGPVAFATVPRWGITFQSRSGD
jgi:hypothetical protein